MIPKAVLELQLTIACLADLPDVMAVENESFGAPWPEEAIAREMNGNDWATVYAAKRGAKTVGYMVCWFVAGECHLQKLAVRTSSRREGVARAMVSFLMDACEERGMDSILLELRETNAAARGLYLGLGFRFLGVRKKYYSDTGEDALLMGFTISEGA